MVVVFAVFILILLFAGWYLDPASIDPARLYLDFVLTATSYLVLLLSLFLSSQSLPADIKSHTIYTVVTKPVRASEVVLGRIVGFTAVTTFLLLVMGADQLRVRPARACPYARTDGRRFAADRRRRPGSRPGWKASTSLVHRHRHKVFISPVGQGPRRDRATAHALARP